KRVTLSKGALTATVAKQASGKSLVFETPNGETTVLGTRLRLIVDTTTTRLEVTEGKVKQTNLADRKSIEVSAGDFTIVAKDVKLVAMPLPKMEILLSYDFEDGKPLESKDDIGSVEKGPERPGSRFCLAGVQESKEKVFRIQIGDYAKGLFTYQGT